MRNAVALGTFDGLHKGHLAVLELPQDYHKIALTFEQPPKAKKTDAGIMLLTTEEKCDRLRKMGFETVCLDFDEVKQIPAETFLQQVRERFHPAYLSCGFNYHFGHNGSGDTALLQRFCAQNGITLHICPPVKDEGRVISSSRIREYLSQGDIDHANRLLSAPFSYTARVAKGDGRGKTLGYPTINQRYPAELAPLKFGVYDTCVEVDGKRYRGITDIGTRPTYPVDYIISETFIRNFSADVYGRTITITPMRFLRPERKFNSAVELLQQITKDINTIEKKER